MAADYLGTTATESDHSVTLTITGDAESLRRRLVEAVQALGYTVLGEQPIYAKRSAQCGARWGCSFEALDYPTKLTLTLKQINEIAVAASFNYEIKSYRRMTKGDRRTLKLEAEAIAALASERLSISACPACGTRVTDDSHFCRRCGAPLVIDAAELEVLRLTRKSRTSYHNLMIAVVTLFAASLFLLPLFWVGPKVFKILVLMSVVFGAFGVLALLQGVWQLHYTLNPKATKDSSARSQPAAALTTALPAAPMRTSVTEGTTELFPANLERETRRTVEPVPRRVIDTGEIDDERLM